MDSSSTVEFYGYVIASYSVMQAIASPLFGYWNQKTKSTKRPVIAGLLIGACGNLLYGLLPTIGGPSKWLMIVARCMVGIGSGSLSIDIEIVLLFFTGEVGVLRAYVATASTTQDRVKATALGIGSFFAGVSLGPVVQAAFQPIGAYGYRIGALELNMYTLPSCILIAGAIVSIIVMQMSFVECLAGIVSTDAKNGLCVCVRHDDF